MIQFLYQMNYDLTFGEMDPNIKHKISHRSIAFDLFSKELLVEKG